MYTVEDKISTQDYLEIQNMLAKNVQRKRAEAKNAYQPRHYKPKHNREVSFERVPKEDQFVKERPNKPSRHTLSAKDARMLLGALAGLIGLGALGAGVAGPVKASLVDEDRYTRPDEGIKPIVDSVDIYEVEKRYAEKMARLGVESPAPIFEASPEDAEGTDGAEPIDRKGCILAQESDAVEEEAPQAVAPTSVSDTMLDYLKSRESFQDTAYLCPAGKWTIGWGHTANVYEGQTTTEEEATEFLRQDIQRATDCVIKEAEEYGVILTQGQFDAFVDFAYNLGNNGFRKSNLMEYMANGDLDGAVEHIKQYVKAKDPATGEMVTLGGLVARREMEAEWMLS